MCFYTTESVVTPSFYNTACLGRGDLETKPVTNTAFSTSFTRTCKRTHRQSTKSPALKRSRLIFFALYLQIKLTEFFLLSISHVHIYFRKKKRKRKKYLALFTGRAQKTCAHTHTLCYSFTDTRVVLQLINLKLASMNKFLA